LRRVAVRAADHAPAIFALVPAAQPHPDDLWLARAAGQLVATLARLGATADWPALVASSAAA
jgi:hypothetical protein